MKVLNRYEKTGLRRPNIVLQFCKRTYSGGAEPVFCMGWRAAISLFSYFTVSMASKKTGLRRPNIVLQFCKRTYSGGAEPVFCMGWRAAISLFSYFTVSMASRAVFS